MFSAASPDLFSFTWNLLAELDDQCDFRNHLGDELLPDRIRVDHQLTEVRLKTEENTASCMTFFNELHFLACLSSNAHYYDICTKCRADKFYTLTITQSLVMPFTKYNKLQ